MAFLSVCLWFGLHAVWHLSVTTYIPWRLVSKRKKAEGVEPVKGVLRTGYEVLEPSSIGQSYHRVFPDPDSHPD